MKCAAGRFGCSTHLAASDCNGLCFGGYFCEEGSTSPTQHACPTPSHFCPRGAGAPTAVSPGFYSTVDSQEECPPGSFCAGGFKVRALDGRTHTCGCGSVDRACVVAVCVCRCFRRPALLAVSETGPGRHRLGALPLATTGFSAPPAVPTRAITRARWDTTAPTAPSLPARRVSAAPSSRPRRHRTARRAPLALSRPKLAPRRVCRARHRPGAQLGTKRVGRCC